MTAVGLAWPVLMWLTPAADRPWISGTSDNSIWSLILGYNGLGRLFGQGRWTRWRRGVREAGGGAGVFGGDPGWLRLLNAKPGRPGRLAARLRAGRRPRAPRRDAAAARRSAHRAG